MKTRKAEKPDTNRKTWEAYRQENLGGLGTNSLALSYEDWKDKKMNDYCRELEKQPQHTPTPWNIDGIRFKSLGPKPKQPQEVCTVSQGERTIVSEIAVKDAAFIVRAVNSHEEFLALLRHLVTIDDDDMDNLDSIKARAREIIEAEGK